MTQLTTKNVQKLPTLKDLVTETDLSIKENALTILCNQPPPVAWIKELPTSKTKYIPIERIEYLLTRIYGKWWVEIRDSKCIANSIVVTIRLFVTNPITGNVEFQDGIGASPIQTNAGAGAMDWNAAKNNGVQLAAPSAETYAIKDAAEKFGKLFGKDLTRKDMINYDNLFKGKEGDPIQQKQWEALPENIAFEISECQHEKDLERLMEFYPEWRSNPNFTTALKKQKLTWKN